MSLTSNFFLKIHFFLCALLRDCSKIWIKWRKVGTNKGTEKKLNLLR